MAITVAGVVLGGCLGAPKHPSPSSNAGMPENDLQIHPDPLEVPLGSLVEIRVQNAGRSAHTFTLHDCGIDTGMMNPGEEKTVKFRADREGRSSSCAMPPATAGPA